MDTQILAKAMEKFLAAVSDAAVALAVGAAASERADVVAFLRKRRRAAEMVAKNYPEDADRAARTVQQIDIEIEMIEQCLHIGDAECEAALVQGVSTSLDTNGHLETSGFADSAEGAA
jgi:hypothetical protein